MTRDPVKQEGSEVRIDPKRMKVDKPVFFALDGVSCAAVKQADGSVEFYRSVDLDDFIDELREAAPTQAADERERTLGDGPHDFLTIDGKRCRLCNDSWEKPTNANCTKDKAQPAPPPRGGRMSYKLEELAERFDDMVAALERIAEAMEKQEARKASTFALPRKCVDCDAPLEAAP